MDIKGTVTLQCSDCIEDISADILFDHKLNPVVSSRQNAISQIKAEGWHLGRRCLCPDCLARAKCNPERCELCKHFHPEGTFDMSYCQSDGAITYPWDTCRHFESKPKRRYTRV